MGKLYSVVAIGALFGIIVGGAYWYGKKSGRVDQLEKTVQAERYRKGLDNAVGNLSDYDLCVRLGGLPDDCDSVRGVEALPKGK